MTGPDKLWAAIILWAGSTGATKVNELPSTWKGVIPKRGPMGPFDVEINGHDWEENGVPPFGAVVGRGQIIPVALSIPEGTTLRTSSVGGEGYDSLVAYFEASTGERK